MYYGSSQQVVVTVNVSIVALRSSLPTPFRAASHACWPPWTICFWTYLTPYT